MKKLRALFTIILISLGINLLGQDFSNLKEIPLTNKEDCAKAQPKIIECCNYLLTKPCIEDLNSLNSVVFIIKWMGATPDFKFGTNDDVSKAIKSNNVLAGTYYAAIAKIAIEKNIKDDSKILQDESITLFLKYCENKEYKVKISNKLQKLIDDMNNGLIGK